MIKIQLLPRQLSAAVLASAFVARIDIVPAETHVALGYAIVAHEQNDPWNTDNSIHQSDSLVMSRDRKVAPALEIECLILFVDRPRDALVEKHESAAHRCDVNRQI